MSPSGDSCVHLSATVSYAHRSFRRFFSAFLPPKISSRFDARSYTAACPSRSLGRSPPGSALRHTIRSRFVMNKSFIFCFSPYASAPPKMNRWFAPHVSVHPVRKYGLPSVGSMGPPLPSSWALGSIFMRYSWYAPTCVATGLWRSISSCLSRSSSLRRNSRNTATGPSALLFPGSFSSLYRQSKSLRFVRWPMLGGSIVSLLLFTSMRVRPRKPPNVSGSVASWLLLRSSTERFSISPISSGSPTSMLFSRFRYVSFRSSAIAGCTVWMRFPERSRSRRDPGREPTVSSTSRSKQPPISSRVMRLSRVRTFGRCSSLL